MKPNEVTLAGIKLYPEERVPIDHARYDSSMRARVRRFIAFQRALLTSQTDIPGVLAGRMVALDLVSVHDLPRALEATPYALDANAYVEWLNGEDLERRHLCVMTTLCLRSSRSPDTEVAALVQLAGTVKGYGAFKETEVLQQVELDRIAWSSERIPKSLWSHVAKVRRFTLLSQKDLVNVRRDVVPAHEQEPHVAEQQAQMADLIDTAVGSGKTLDVMPDVVQLASAVFSIEAEKSDAEHLRDWGKALLGLRPHVELGDVASAVVVGWNYFLVTNGTSTSKKAALSTRARYARVANKSIWRIVAALPPKLESWTPALIRAGCEAAMQDHSCKDKKGLGAALSSFQQFLEEEFGVEVSLAGLHHLIPPSKPLAKWLAPTAIARAVTWLHYSNKGDERLLSIGSVMLLLASSRPFRIGELRWLRMANVHFPKCGGVEIEVTPIEGINPLKTDAATRRVGLPDGEACRSLRTWFERRLQEGAPDTAYLFGEPDQDDKLYRPHAVHTLLLETLKRATGDTEVTFHSLRHTVISNDVEQILLLTEPGPVNRFAALADQAGHAVAATSFEHYAHRIETPLRRAIDRELSLLPITNAEGESITGMKANTLTQAARREESDLKAQVWAVAAKQARNLVMELPDAAEDIVWTEPTPPNLSGPVARAFTVKRCLDALAAMARGVSSSLIEHRHGLGTVEQGLLVAAVQDVAAALYRKNNELPPPSCTTVRTVFNLFGFDIARTGQPKYRELLNFCSLPQDPQLLASASLAWVGLWWDGETSAAEPAALVPIFKLLHQADVSPSNLLICKEPDGEAQQSLARYRAAVDWVSFSAFNQSVPVQELGTARPGRATAYLLWTSGPGVGPAGKSNAGFDVLMFTMAVWASPKLSAWRRA